MVWCALAECDLRLRSLVLVAVALLARPVCPVNAAEHTLAERITVEQFQQKLAVLARSIPAHDDVPEALLQDATLAQQIENVQLSERLTSATLEGILTQHTFGPQTKRALTLLADRSALLDPPQNELPSRPPPDAKLQQQWLDGARVFVFQTLSHLPNFFATRTTARFAGISPELNQTGLPVRVGLYPRGSFTREITFRNGKEVIDPMKFQRQPATLPQSGLESWGEFGPEPAVVLSDVTNGTIAFHHWEQTASGVAAVFRYSVPAQNSHYEVNCTCNGRNAFHAQPGYHGSLAIDPVSGAILRITLQADWKPEDPLSHVASVVDYGPVEIGGRTYICPVRSLAFSVEEVSVCFRELKDDALVHNRALVKPLILNRTTFSDYHRLGSTSRIVTEVPDMGPNE